MAKDYKINMLDGGIFGKILLFSLPVMLSGVLQLLFNAADTIVVGRFAGEDSLAAVGSTGSITSMFVNLFVGLSVGTNVIVAQGIGSGDDKTVHDTVHTSVLFSVMAGLFLLVFGFFAAEPVLWLMGTPEDVIGKAVLYIRICFCGMPVSMLYNYSSAVLRAVGDTRRPMIYLIIAGIINVALNLIFVIVFKMDVAGVAIATVISQTVSAILVVRTLIKMDGALKLELSELKINKRIILKMMKIGIPTGIGGIVVSFSHMTIQSAINSFGKVAIAGNTASGNLEGFMYLAVNAVGQGALSFTAQNLAARKIDRIKKVSITCSCLGPALAFLISVIVITFSGNILSLYTDSAEVIKYGMIRVTYSLPFYFVYGFAEIFAGELRGMGRSLAPTIISIMTTCLFRVLWVWFFPINNQMELLYICYPISWFLEAMGHFIYFIIVFAKEKKNYGNFSPNMIY